MQKVKDIILLLQKDRRSQVMAGLAVAVVLFLVFSPDQRRRRGPAPVENEQLTGTAQEDEAYTDIVRAFSEGLESTRSDVKRIYERLDESDQKLDKIQNSTADIFKKILERMTEIENNPHGGTGNPDTIDVGSPGEVGLSDDSSLSGGANDGIESFGELKAEAAPPLPPEPQKVAFVGAGDSVRVKLLAGVNAPTDGTPYPVVFQLMSDVFGPDNSQLPLGEARVVAAAQGSLTDSRALFRLTSMNVRLPNGRRKVLPVDGWIVGEDGIRGMEGVLIDPIGKAIGAAGFAGFLQGVGEGFASSQSTTIANGVGGASTFVDGNVAQFAAGKGLSGAADAYAGLIQDRVNALVPVVQVLSGREATAVFSKSISISDLYEALEMEDSGYTGID